MSTRPDIGKVKPGQAVSVSVDAFADRQIRGSVQQVRLSATIVTGLFFGYYPARKASLRDPIEALWQQ